MVIGQVVCFHTRSPGASIIARGSFKGYVSSLPSLLSNPVQNGFQEPLQDHRANILQPAANARDQTVTVIIQTVISYPKSQFPPYAAVLC